MSNIANKARKEEVVKKIGIEEYLNLEKESKERLEYVDGEALLMEAITIEHSRIAGNVIASITRSLGKRPCVVLPEVGLHVESKRVDFRKPDISIVCGSVKRSKYDKEKITNPTVIVEILSKSTKSEDRGNKAREYSFIPGLKEYVIIPQDNRRVEVWKKTKDGWVVAYIEKDRFELKSIGCFLSIKKIYHDPLSTPRAKNLRAKELRTIVRENLNPTAIISKDKNKSKSLKK